MAENHSTSQPHVQETWRALALVDGYETDADILDEERKRKGWTVEQQADRMGLDRSDFYKALKGKLPPKSRERRPD